MSRSRSLLSVTALCLVVGLGSSPAAADNAAPAQVQAQGRKPVANASKMGRAAFEALSDDDVLEVNGKPHTPKTPVMIDRPEP